MSYTGTEIGKHYSKPDYFLKLSIILNNGKLVPPQTILIFIELMF